MGLSPQLVNWIKAWLSNRKQRVVINGYESDWISVISSVVQGSVLGPCLFIIFIDDIDLCVKLIRCILMKFADDTKVAKSITRKEDADLLQVIIDNLCEWCKKWGMSFNVGKCKIMHLGFNNLRMPYYMDGTPLEVSEEERDLGILISDNLKPAHQCAAAAKKAMQVIGRIRRCFTCYDKETMTLIYKAYVRPVMEFAVPAWRPWAKKNIEVLEAVQKRMVRMISGLTGNYDEKLKQIGLTTLEDQRIWGDCIEVFKILNGHTDVDPGIWFHLTNEVRVDGAITRHSATHLALEVVKPNLEICRIINELI
jgi:hypothetical protein